jgi:hypothetical protein
MLLVIMLDLYSYQRGYKVNPSIVWLGYKKRSVDTQSCQIKNLYIYKGSQEDKSTTIHDYSSLVLSLYVS